MKPIGFKSLQAETAFFRNLGDSAFEGVLEDNAPVEIKYATARVNRSGLNILGLCQITPDTERNMVFLTSSVNNPSYQEGVEFQRVHAEINPILHAIHEKSVNILAYNQGGGVKTDKIKIPHRALYVGEDIKGQGTGELLHKTMERIAGECKREVTFVPSILLFYLKQGFSISGLYMRVEGEDKLVQYDNLSSEQQQILYNCIVLAAKHGDLSLPFHVELRKLTEKPNFQYTEECPSVLVDILGSTQARMNTDGSRSEIELPQYLQADIELGFGLTPQTGLLQRGRSLLRTFRG